MRVFDRQDCLCVTSLSVARVLVVRFRDYLGFSAMIDTGLPHHICARKRKPHLTYSSSTVQSRKQGRLTAARQGGNGWQSRNLLLSSKMASLPQFSLCLLKPCSSLVQALFHRCALYRLPAVLVYFDQKTFDNVKLFQA